MSGRHCTSRAAVQRYRRSVVFALLWVVDSHKLRDRVYTSVGAVFLDHFFHEDRGSILSIRVPILLYLQLCRRIPVHAFHAFTSCRVDEWPQANVTGQSAEGSWPNRISLKIFPTMGGPACSPWWAADGLPIVADGQPNRLARVRAHGPGVFLWWPRGTALPMGTMLCPW